MSPLISVGRLPLRESRENDDEMEERQADTEGRYAAVVLQALPCFYLKLDGVVCKEDKKRTLDSSGYENDGTLVGQHTIDERGCLGRALQLEGEVFLANNSYTLLETVHGYPFSRTAFQVLDTLIVANQFGPSQETPTQSSTR